ncbi:hypothetical protein BZA05DRAFT_264462 [Tricharina praecox]|uniref:uncharacterized protein n=1 Tax=Tricharina praecox TaxID=43433 RepID=UPI00221FFD3E|nr:uncharacterized protein BZA05DRAFT_264462 [Tricharina praecox]KAI5854398.1 hypothetical protein BZA05DRAFT_264462 [Tricharina praecox]
MWFSTSTGFTAAIAVSALLPVTVLSQSDPCAEFAETRGNRVTGLDANLFRRCIQSVPFDEDKATRTLHYLRMFLGLDTYAPYLVDPPVSELELEPFNLNETLSEIESNIKSGSYENNWSFDYDVVRMFQMFRDGHTDYETVCSHGFIYVHEFPIASIASGDGTPEIYHVIKNFAAAQWEEPRLGAKIKKINGKEPQEYLTDFIRNSPESLDWVDPDARYNEMMYGFPEGTFRGRFARRNMWNGEDLTITWENGTDTKVEFTLQLTTSMYKDGELLFNDTQSLIDLCFLSETEIGNSGSAAVDDEQADDLDLVVRQTDDEKYRPDGYPTPLNHSSEYAMATFSVPDDKEAVVLAIRTFDQEDLSADDFVHAMSEFLKDQVASWKKSGYKRLIIDVSNNSGGKAILPYDFLKQLFPSKEDFPPVNMHYSPVTWAYMHAINGGKEYEMYKDTGMKDFADMADFLGPVRKDNEYYSKTWKQDYEQFGEVNYNLEVAAASNEQPFSAENIAIISNSHCASACHSIVESLRNQGVRAFAYGGRANASTPMQPVGGTKGGKVLRYDNVRGFLERAQDDDTVLEAAGDQSTWLLQTLPVRIKNVNVNSENKFREGNRLPLQFVYTPACNRFFVDKTMFGDISAVWKKTREVAWGSDGKAVDCVDYDPIEPEDTFLENDESASTGKDSEKESAGQVSWKIPGCGWLVAPGLLACALLYI